MYYCSLYNILTITNIATFDKFKNFVNEEDFYVFDKEKQCIEAVSLCKNTEELSKDNLNKDFVNIVKTNLIISKIRNIARQCVQEKLKEYSQDVGSALAEFEEIFVEEVRGI